MVEGKSAGINAEAKASIVNVEKVDVNATGLGELGLKIFDAFLRFGFPRKYIQATNVEAQRIEIIARAESNADLIRQAGKVEEALIAEEGEFQLRMRAAARLATLETQRQAQIEAMKAKAIEVAKAAPENVSQEPVSDQFMAILIDSCQDTSDEWMQWFWAKIIAGEFAKPGSFSPRTLNVVRTLQKRDAELFTKFCSFAWGFPDENHKFVPNVKSMMHGGNFWDPGLLRKVPSVSNDFVEINVGYYGRMELESAGLIKMNPSNQGIGVTISSGAPLVLHYFGTAYKITAVVPSRLDFMADYFTPVGNELYSACKPEPHDEFRKQLIDAIRYFRFAVEP
jgi:hypothetical protein